MGKINGQSKSAVITVLLLCILLTAGCASGGKEVKAKEQYVIGVVTKSQKGEYWMSVCAGIEKAAKDNGVDAVILSPDSETDEEVQKRMILDLVKMKVNAIAVSPINSYENTEYIEAAAKMKIPVYAYDTAIEDEEIPYIGIDHEKTGYELGEVLAKKLEYRGSIAIIAGSMQHASHKERVEGFRRCMEQYPDIRIEVVKSGYSNLRVSEQEMEKLKAEYPGLDGIMTTSAVTALGIAEGMQGSGIYIASVDAQEDAVQAVADGKIAALAAQSGYDIGYETVAYILRDRDGKEQEMREILAVETLTQENAKEYLDLKK